LIIPPWAGIVSSRLSADDVFHTAAERNFFLAVARSLYDIIWSLEGILLDSPGRRLKRSVSRDPFLIHGGSKHGVIAMRSMRTRKGCAKLRGRASSPSKVYLVG